VGTQYRGVVLAKRALRDLERVHPPAQKQAIAAAIDALLHDAPSLDVRPLRGKSPLRRLRHGDYRVLFRPLSAEEGEGYLVAHIAHRQDLENAVRKL
jgi:mRNA-degrading endonuclease RelE of RelBE toxin-antitoxin system